MEHKFKFKYDVAKPNVITPAGADVTLEEWKTVIEALYGEVEYETCCGEIYAVLLDPDYVDRVAGGWTGPQEFDITLVQTEYNVAVQMLHEIQYGVTEFDIDYIKELTKYN